MWVPAAGRSYGMHLVLTALAPRFRQAREAIPFFILVKELKKYPDADFVEYGS